MNKIYFVYIIKKRIFKNKKYETKHFGFLYELNEGDFTKNKQQVIKRKVYNTGPNYFVSEMFSKLSKKLDTLYKKDDLVTYCPLMIYRYNGDIKKYFSQFTQKVL